jgi:hypothetical protein
MGVSRGCGSRAAWVCVASLFDVLKRARSGTNEDGDDWEDPESRKLQRDARVSGF